MLLTVACKKEPDNDDNLTENMIKKTTLTLDHAKDFISLINPDSSKVLAKINIDWELARNEHTYDGNKWIIPLDGQPTYQNYKQGYRQLVILRNSETQKVESKILEIIPDAIYLQKNKIARAADFTGRVFEYNLNYKLTGGRVFSNGKPVGRIQQFSRQQQIDQANQMLKDPNPFRGAQGKLMKLMAIETCAWLQDWYIDVEGDFTVHSTQVCSTSYFDDGAGGGGSYYDGVGGNGGGKIIGGGSGNSGPTSPPSPSNLPGEDKSPVNPREMMECFSKISSPNAAFVVKVYVIEPQPGTSFNVGSNSFGHVAISLSKTSGTTTITQTVGFYPTGLGLEKLSSTSKIIDNGDIEYNIGATYYVGTESFQNLINYISNPPKNYHFTDYNSAVFVYEAGKASGIPIPDPTTQIGIAGRGGAGFAKTPAGMANALRERKAAYPNSDINSAGGRAPGSNGPCKIE